MKFCKYCCEELATKDGENVCRACEEGIVDLRKKDVAAKARKQKREREQVLRDCGLTKVRGAMGGVYWE